MTYSVRKLVFSPFILLSLLFILYDVSLAQSDQTRFDEALELYQEGNFKHAAVKFAEIDIPEASLFTGKSYFAAGQYNLSSHYLSKVPSNAPAQIYDDSRYTLALNDFQTGNYGRSLDRLYLLKDDASTRSIRSNAENFYEQTLDYLTIEQRKKAFAQSTLEDVQLDIVTSSFKWVDQQTAGSLVSSLGNSLISLQDSARIQSLHRQVSRMNANSPSEYAPAPDGITYNVGIALPESDDQNVQNVSRSMYYGLAVAAEDFNRRNDNRKIALHFANPDGHEDGPEHIMTNFAWNQHVDLVIGPLFSESAYRMTALAEQYQIPLITPLANSDTLNLDNPYVFQVNPTFAERGKAMARYAVNELGLRNLAIISERYTPAEEEAHAFHSEATRLGANFVHIFNENFEARGYDISQVTPWFAGDTTYVDTEEFDLQPVDGLFLATGGQGATHLIDLVITDMEAMRSNVTVLGNEEMGNVEMSARRLQRLDIYFPEIFLTDESKEDVINFRIDYKNLSGMDADMFSFLGYDVANYLFATLEKTHNPARLKDAIKNQPRIEGLTVNIDFNNSHINQAIRIMNATSSGPVQIQ